MKHLFVVTLAFLMSLLPCSSCGAAAAKDTLIYCSYAKDGAAGLGLDYCELVADPGSTPKVVVVLDKNNRFQKPVTQKEFEVSEEDVARLAAALDEIKVRRLDGYHYVEPITGGYEYRIHVEYASGKNVSASWYGSKVKDSAIQAYNTIWHFFDPWVAKVRSEEVAPVAADS